MAKNVLAICVLLSAQTALANQVTQVSAGAGSVRITADEPPNFTTFTIDYPPRLVIDVAGATLVDVPTNIQVGQGGVTGIQTLPYGSGTSAVARIIIMYDKPVQTDIMTDGNSIVVRQAEAPATAAAPPAAARPPPSPQPTAPAPQPVQQAAALPPPPTPAPAPAAPALAAPLPPPPRPAAAEPVVAVAAPSQPPRNPENAAPERPVQPSPPPSTVVAQNEAPYPEEPIAPPVEPPPSQPAPAPVTARAAAPAAPLRLNTQANLASPPPPPATEEAPQVTAKRKTLSLVGLRFNNGGMSVFVRTNEPVSYHVSERPNGLVVTIENTRIRRHNDTRPLDAHFFDSPVAKVQAIQNRGDVEVNIDLKTHAAYQATQAGPEVQLSFNHG